MPISGAPPTSGGGVLQQHLPQRQACLGILRNQLGHPPVVLLFLLVQPLAGVHLGHGLVGAGQLVLIAAGLGDRG